MNKFLKLIVLVTCGFTAGMASAKNKEDCHKSSGKWMPGSATDAEVGTCWFLIKAGPKDTNPRVLENAITSDACQSNRGKISKDGKQCAIEFSAASPAPTNSMPKASSKAMSELIETGQMLDKGKPKPPQ